MNELSESDWEEVADLVEEVLEAGLGASDRKSSRSGRWTVSLSDSDEPWKSALLQIFEAEVEDEDWDESREKAKKQQAWAEYVLTQRWGKPDLATADIANLDPDTAALTSPLRFIWSHSVYEFAAWQRGSLLVWTGVHRQDGSEPYLVWCGVAETGGRI